MDKDIERFYGFYRAKVVDTADDQEYGRVTVWIPDIMTYIPESAGIFARPANNPVGGRNEQDGTDNNYAGTSYIPKTGSWIWVFFEAGNINRPYYFAALDLENAKVLPEVRVGSNKTDKWVIFKSHDGRTIVVSDDPDDTRVEITGKKRLIKEPPSGDTDSVYTIDENQTSILLDERDGKQKVLIRTYKGDFFHIDIDEQELQAYFKSDIKIKSDGNIYITANEELHLKGKLGKVNIQSEADTINMKAAGNIIQESGGGNETKAGTGVFESAATTISSLAGTIVSHDPIVSDAGGTSTPAMSSEDATDADPVGERDT